jgi:hypothetical protein
MRLHGYGEVHGIPWGMFNGAMARLHMIERWFFIGRGLLITGNLARYGLNSSRPVGSTLLRQWRVEVEGDGIVVTLPGTTLRVIYGKPNQSPGLVAFDVRGDEVPVSLRLIFSPALGA